MAEITIRYNGENGETWTPASKRKLWEYAVRSGQIVLPAPADGGEYGEAIESGEDVVISWIPPEYAGRLREVPAPPRPTHFAIDGDDNTVPEEADTDE